MYKQFRKNDQVYCQPHNNLKLYNFNKITIGSFTTIAVDELITNVGHDLAILTPSSGILKND